MDTRLRWLLVPLILTTYLWNVPERLDKPALAPVPGVAEVRPVEEIFEFFAPDPKPQVTRHQQARADLADRREARRVAVRDKFRQTFAAHGYAENLGNLAVSLAYEIGADPLLLFALIDLESRFNCDLIHGDSNGTQDYGCMQLNDVSWRTMARNLDLPDADPLNPTHNLRMGAWWLGTMHRRFGTWEAALTAYNTGEFGLQRIQRETGGSAGIYSRAVLGRYQRLLDQLPPDE